MLRALLVVALAASSCTDWLGPELTAPPDASGTAGTAGAGGQANECAPASDFGELAIDFEEMMSASDRFQLGELPGGFAVGGYVSSSSGVFIRQGHDEPSQRSLLLLLPDGLDTGTLSLTWSSCLDATTRSGITFWARGEASSASVHPQTYGAVSDVECSAPRVTIALTTDWQMYRYEWAEFCPGSSASPRFPSKLSGLIFTIQETATEPWLALDDVSFSAGP